MPAIQLQFYQAGSYPYPYATTGSGTAMTMCLRSNDPMLAFVTQTSFSDEIVFFRPNLSVPVEDARFATPAGHDVINGMAYDRFEHRIWAVQSTQNQDLIIGIDPDTGALADTITVPARFGLGLACNGLYFIRSDGAVLESIGKGGTVLGSMNVPAGSHVAGLSAAFWSFLATDTAVNRIAVLGVFGHLIAECRTPPGAAGGITAVAYDDILTIADFDFISQLPTENGAWGDVGTPYHPDTPWDPPPWGVRHRIYLANEIDQTIYFGYFFE